MSETNLYYAMKSYAQMLPCGDIRARFSEMPTASVEANIMRLKREGVISEKPLVVTPDTVTDDDLVFEGERHWKKKS